MPKRKPGSDSEEEDPPSAEEDSPPPSDAETEQAEEEAGGAEEEEYEDEVIDKKRYCFCRGFDDGTTMVGCETETCQYEWFHFECVGLSEPPAEGETWHCQACLGQPLPAQFQPDLREKKKKKDSDDEWGGNDDESESDDEWASGGGGGGAVELDEDGNPKPRKPSAPRKPKSWVPVAGDCENCGERHDGNYGSGRFCGQPCRSQFNGRKCVSNPRAGGAGVPKGHKGDGSYKSSNKKKPKTKRWIETETYETDGARRGPSRAAAAVGDKKRRELLEEADDELSFLHADELRILREREADERARCAARAAEEADTVKSATDAEAEPSDYEKQRLANMARNRGEMARLGLI